MPNIAQLSKTSNIKIEGICSSDRIPSLGEWQRFLTTGSMYLYYGSTSVLNLIAPNELLELIDCYKGKATVIIDKINPLKRFVRKYSPIHADHEKTPINELPKLVMGLMTLLGSSSIITNTFSIDPLVNTEYLDIFLDTMGKNNGYLGEVYKKFLVCFLSLNEIGTSRIFCR